MLQSFFCSVSRESKAIFGTAPETLWYVCVCLSNYVLCVCVCVCVIFWNIQQVRINSYLCKFDHFFVSFFSRDARRDSIGSRLCKRWKYDSLVWGRRYEMFSCTSQEYIRLNNISSEKSCSSKHFYEIFLVDRVWNFYSFTCLMNLEVCGIMWRKGPKWLNDTTY